MKQDKDVLLVCSGGGHLRQLAVFAERLGYAPEQQVWVTFRNALSESLLEGRRVEFVPFIAPRDLKNFARLLTRAPGIFAKYRLGEVISTGSSPAVAFLPQAVMRGIPAFYIESAARAEGPSMTGKMISRMPGVKTFTQYPVWADAKWVYRGSIFDGFEPGPTEAKTPRTAVVTVGTQEGFPFPRMLAALKPLLAGYDKVLWQTGDADTSSLGIPPRASVPHSELGAAIRDADVVISHAGVGSALTALSFGKHPLLIPREAAHEEHIDDHQVQVARELERRGLATLRTVSQLTAADLVDAGSRSVQSVAPPRMALRPQRGTLWQANSVAGR